MKQTEAEITRKRDGERDYERERQVRNTRKKGNILVYQD
jgi:hypothetical protein